MDKPLVSVIVPVYKTERCLQRCTDSIFAQTYPAVEVILVDDGSPDNCPALCDSIAQSHPFVTVHHQENAGTAAARRAGVALAAGEYIAFVDSDDYIDPQMYERMMSCIGDADLCECGWIEQDETTGACVRKPAVEQTLRGRDCLECFAAQRISRNFLCNKLYRAPLLKNLLCPVRSISEDAVWNAQIFMKANKMVMIEQPLYYYVQREESVCHRPISERNLEVLDAWEFIYHLWKEEMPGYEAYAALHLCSNAAQLHACAADLSAAQREPIQQRALAVFRRYDRKNSKWHIASRNRRMLIRLFRLSPQLAGMLFRKTVNKKK